MKENSQQDWRVKAGRRVLKLATGIERRLYRLHKGQCTVDEHCLHYLDSGQSQGPVLILLHGFSADKTVWLRFARFFSKDYRVIIPDLAGHGDSCFHHQHNYSVPEQARRVVALMDALDISKAHIAGNSMGGFIAAHLGRYFAPRCHSLVLVDPAGLASPQPSPLDMQLKQGHNPFLIRSLDEFPGFYRMTMAKPPYLPKVVLEALSVEYQQRRDRLEKIFRDFFMQHTLENELSQIKLPTLVLWGEQDQLIDISALQPWIKGISHSQHTVWQDLGHMPMVEAPKRAARRVRQFLAHLPA